MYNIICEMNLPVQVRCRIQDAWGWCMGMTQRDVVRREVGGGFRMGNTCTPMVDSCCCIAKPIQYCKVKNNNNNKEKKEVVKQEITRLNIDILGISEL